MIVDDDPDIIQSARTVLRQHFTNVSTETDPRQLPFLLSHDLPDVVLLDMNFTADVTKGTEGLYWLKKILQDHPHLSVIMVTAFGDVKLAVDAMKEGAVDFVVKPWDNEKLVATVTSASQLSKSKQEVDRLRSHQSRISEVYAAPETELIGNSPAMLSVLSMVKKVAATEANVLILGENGTGKELIAKAIHQQSARKDAPFIKVDVGTIPDSLFESELFGHRRGAFTDARENRTGRLELASGGTLFLDEIGNLPLSLQSKLLTVLQNRVVSPLGSNEQIPIDIRLVSATNRPVRDMVMKETFREDLLYRLNTVEIELPPLRERLEDIPYLLNYFVSYYARKYNKAVEPENSLGDELTKYNWPGNVREFQHAVERAIILSSGKKISIADFQIPQAKDKYVPATRIDDIEREAIARAIEKYAGNLSKAAKELGMGRTTLYRKIEKYGL